MGILSITSAARESDIHDVLLTTTERDKYSRTLFLSRSKSNRHKPVTQLNPVHAYLHTSERISYCTSCSFKFERSSRGLPGEWWIHLNPKKNEGWGEKGHEKKKTEVVEGSRRGVSPPPSPSPTETFRSVPIFPDPDETHPRIKKRPKANAGIVTRLSYHVIPEITIYPSVGLLDFFPSAGFSRLWAV